MRSAVNELTQKVTQHIIQHASAWVILLLHVHPNRMREYGHHHQSEASNINGHANAQQKGGCAYLHADSYAARMLPSPVCGDQWPQPCCCSTVAKVWLWETVLEATAQAPQTVHQRVLYPVVENQPTHVRTRPMHGLHAQVQKHAAAQAHDSPGTSLGNMCMLLAQKLGGERVRGGPEVQCRGARPEWGGGGGVA